MFATTSLPGSATSPSVARAWAAQLCRSHGFEEIAPSAELIVSELVTNAVVHARSDVVVTMTVLPDPAGTSQLRVAVRDIDSRLPRWEQVGDDALGGRGLELVRSLSHDCGVEIDDLGKTVWAAFHLVGEEADPSLLVVEQRPSNLDETIIDLRDPLGRPADGDVPRTAVR